jgi:hypothetical protein
MKYQLSTLVAALFFLSCGISEDVEQFTGPQGERGIQGERGVQGLPGVSKITFRPSFHSSGIHRVVFPASPSTPKIVYIDGSEHTNISDTEASLAVNGEGGLESGTRTPHTIYYAYAIPLGEGWQTVLSPRRPELGPENFPKHSYLGSFVTAEGGIISPFQFVKGRIYLADSALNYGSNSEFVEEKTINIPAHATVVFGKAYFHDPVRTDRWGAVLSEGQMNRDYNDMSMWTTFTTSSLRPAPGVSGQLPILKPQTVWMVVQDSANLLAFHITGWQESPEEYK